MRRSWNASGVIRLRPARAAGLAAQRFEEATGPKHELHELPIQSRRISGEHGKLGGDDRLVYFSRQDADGAAAGVDLGKNDIARIGGEVAAFVGLSTIPRRDLAGQVDRDRRPVSERVGERQKLAPLRDQLAQLCQREVR